MRNPLLDPKQPHGLPDFPAIRPEHVLPALDQLLQAYREGIEQSLSGGPGGGWPMVEAEIGWADALARAWSPVSHLNSVADNESLRAAYNAGLEKLTEYESWRQQHAGIFQAYEAMRAARDFDRLSPEQQRIIELELRDFRLAGVALPGPEKQRYRDLVMRLSQLGSRFSENLQDATHAWSRHFDAPEGLRGLPQTELNLLAAIAQAEGKQGWLVNLSAPSYHAVMTHAEDPALRRAVYTAYVTRASDHGPNAGQWDNLPLIREMLSLRHQLAQLLGFGNYVDYALSRRMAQSAHEVSEFLNDLAARARPAAVEQYQSLLEFAAGQGASLPLEAWDVAFWSERYRQSELQLSDEELKPYFPLGSMLDALQYTAGQVFGTRLVPDGSIAGWHPDVKFFWLENEQGERVGGLFMDLFARKNKRGGAWMDVCRSRRRIESDVQCPVAYLTCNFAPPAGDQPSLLTHEDVQTLFHEFGHCLHHLLTRIDWPQINGINNVEWDAVELPSQLLENWCWEETILDRFARHHQHGRPMPADLKDRLLRSRHFQKALFLVRQLEYAICDLRLHLEYDPENPADPLQLLSEVRQSVSVVPVPEWNRFLNGFGHIFGGGYAAGYYSYLWAELLAADAWGRFRQEGTLNRAPGDAFRREILAAGAARPALDSFRAFRGRAPAAEPLLENYGLQTSGA